MVCLGNICRSPLAEGILTQQAAQAGLHWLVDSAGTGGWHIGNPPHLLSQKVAGQHGIDISAQKCRRFVAEDMQRFDRVYFMDEDNYKDARIIAGPLWKNDKAKLLLNELYPGQNLPVPDPYYGNDTDYEHVFNLISKACEALISRYQSTLKK